VLYSENTEEKSGYKSNIVSAVLKQ
jgi:hypothetical protein